MIKVIWDQGFKRSYKRKAKNNDEYKKKFWDALELFVKDAVLGCSQMERIEEI